MALMSPCLLRSLEELDIGFSATLHILLCKTIANNELPRCKPSIVRDNNLLIILVLQHDGHTSSSHW